MHEFIYFHRQIFRVEEALMQAISAAALYGKGIFTTVAIYNSKPFLWEKHWLRLENNAKKIGIDLSDLAAETVKNALFETIEKNRCKAGRARLTFFDQRSGGIWKFKTARKTSLLITTADFRRLSDDFRLTVSLFPVNSKSPLANVKSCNYLENLLASDEAKNRGFDEAIRLNERGEITSTCSANIFWLENERLFTPPLETGCLGGTTREFLTEKFSATEAKSNLESLQNADAIFLTSAGIGVVQVNEFEGRKFERKFEEITSIVKKTTSDE